MEKLSVYILTKNSEKYLSQIIKQISPIADEIIVLDSGSTDKTREICQAEQLINFSYRKFDNFKNQRDYAAGLCKYQYVMYVDSDEIPDNELIESIHKLKNEGFKYDIYRIKRVWHVFGKKITSIYPIVSPDFPERIFDKNICNFSDANFVHETLSGYSNYGIIEKGLINHHTFHDKAELYNKMDTYTKLAAADLLNKGKKTNLLKYFFSPIGAFFKYYFIKQGCKDGYIGLVLGFYAYNYTRKKYYNARLMKKEKEE